MAHKGLRNFYTLRSVVIRMLPSHDSQFAHVMPFWAIAKLTQIAGDAAVPWCPYGETAHGERAVANICLGVARVSANRMEFKQLATKILVRRPPAGSCVVQIDQHGGRRTAGQQHVAKCAEGIAS